MACNNNTTGAGVSISQQTGAVTRVSSGGESVSIDINSVKATNRYHDSQQLVNIVNKRVRKTFGTIVGATPQR